MGDTGIPPVSCAGKTATGATGETHDGNDNDTTGHDRMGDMLCFVQGEARRHEPQYQSWEEIAVHVIEKTLPYSIKYFVDILNNFIILFSE